MVKRERLACFGRDFVVGLFAVDILPIVTLCLILPHHLHLAISRLIPDRAYNIPIILAPSSLLLKPFSFSFSTSRLTFPHFARPHLNLIILIPNQPNRIYLLPMGEAPSDRPPSLPLAAESPPLRQGTNRILIDIFNSLPQILTI